MKNIWRNQPARFKNEFLGIVLDKALVIVDGMKNSILQTDSSHQMLGRRIVVVGSSGSGKTTLARALARRLGYRHIELDAIHWQPNWVETPLARFREQLEPLLAGDEWTIDGNYSKVRDMVWGRADTLIWLDYSLPVILWRLWWRSLKRIILRQELWNSNRESWRAFIGRDSLFLWVLQSQPRHRREYPLKFQQPEFAHLKIVHLHSTHETDKWFKTIDAPRPDSLS